MKINQITKHRVKEVIIMTNIPALTTEELIDLETIKKTPMSELIFEKPSEAFCLAALQIEGHLIRFI